MTDIEDDGVIVDAEVAATLAHVKQTIASLESKMQKSHMEIVGAIGGWMAVYGLAFLALGFVIGRFAK